MLYYHVADTVSEVIEIRGWYFGEMSMSNGILVCGLNGVGKSTLAKALAEELNYSLFMVKTKRM